MLILHAMHAAWKHGSGVLNRLFRLGGQLESVTYSHISQVSQPWATKPGAIVLTTTLPSTTTCTMAAAVVVGGAATADDATTPAVAASKSKCILPVYDAGVLLPFATLLFSFMRGLQRSVEPLVAHTLQG
jgi:hypothetical protein